MGAKKKPFYRIVVADARSPRDGKAIAQLGYYDPMRTPHVIKLDVDQAKQWIEKGAQPTDKVRHLLTKVGALEAARVEVAQ